MCMIVQAYLVVSLTVRFPLIGFDSIGNFGMKGMLWYHTHQLIPDQLLDPDFLTYKRTYPPVIPLTEAVYSIFGGWNDAHLKLFFVVCWIATGLLIFSILHARRNRVFSWIAIAFWIMLPYNLYNFGGGATNGFGELPFALAILIATWLVIEFHGTKSLPMILFMGFVVAGTFWVKKEGIPFVLGVFIYMVWKRVPVRTIALVLAVSILTFVVHALTVRNLPTYYEGKDISLSHSIRDLVHRAGSFFGFAYEEFSRIRHWGELFWYLILSAWVFKLIFRGIKKSFGEELLFFAYMFAVYVVVCHLNVLDFYKVMSTTFDRLFLHVYPLLVIATFHGIETRRENSLTVASQDS